MIKRLLCRLGLHRRDRYIGMDLAHADQTTVVSGKHCRWCGVFWLNDVTWVSELARHTVLSKVRAKGIRI